MTVHDDLYTLTQEDAHKLAMYGDPDAATNGVAPDDAAITDPVHTAQALYQLPDPPEDAQLLGPLIVRRYRTVIAGGTGEGKTTLALQAIAAITQARDLLGWTGQGGRALIIDLEQGLRTVKRRLREAGLADSTNVDYWRIPDGLALDTDDTHKQAVEQQIAHGRYDIVLLDPIYKAHRGDSNDERAIVDLMRTFDRWRETYGFALAIPMHIRKKLEPKQAPIMDDIFGSGGAVRGAEIVVGIQRISDGYSRLHAWKDRDGDELPVGQDPWGLIFDRDAGYRRDPNELKPARDLEQEIATFLNAFPESTSNRVAEGVAAGRGTVQKTLRDSDCFSFTNGPNRSKLWVANVRQYHLGHPVPPEASVGGQSGGPSIEGHTWATGDSGSHTPEYHPPPDLAFLDTLEQPEDQ